MNLSSAFYIRFLQSLLSYNIYRHHASYCNVIMSTIASQITGVSIVYSTICSDADQRKLQSSASLAVRGIHRWPVNSPHKGPVTRRILPFDDVIICHSRPPPIMSVCLTERLPYESVRCREVFAGQIFDIPARYIMLDILCFQQWNIWDRFITLAYQCLGQWENRIYIEILSHWPRPCSVKD